ncbi:MAG: methyltransferase domain-containing protein [Gammaproteobacteria bacterium]
MNKHLDTGSYRFGGFGDDAGELRRLDAQARSAERIEVAALKEAGVRPGLSIIDVGCGHGAVTRLLATMTGPEGSVLGLDSNPDLLAENRKGEHPANCRFAQADVYDLSAYRGQFDFAYGRFLLQHLERGPHAVEQISATVRPGGTICLADVDDGWLTLEPEPSGFGAFLERASRGQTRLGGDRRVGRKLARYLSAAGCTSVRVGVHVISSDDLGLKTFLDLITGLKMEMIGADERADALRERDDIYRLLENPDARGFVGIFVATGVRAQAAMG